ncbi:MAG: hypothetical protein HQL52_05380, partial [Magnetococcales bacterium]|nr:hypothetical protein [Magnetococcales bacterium]
MKKTGLAALFTPDENGDRLFMRVAQILLARELEERDGKLPSLNTTSQFAIWGADTLLVCHFPSESLGGNSFKKYSLAFLARQVEKPPGIKRVVVVAQLDRGAVPSRFEEQIKKLSFKWVGKSEWEWWDAPVLQEKIIHILPLALRFFPDLIPGSPKKRTDIQKLRKRYDREFYKLYSKIQFVGMSVYKEEATAGIPMERIYIPLEVIPWGWLGPAWVHRPSRVERRSDQ